MVFPPPLAGQIAFQCFRRGVGIARVFSATVGSLEGEEGMRAERWRDGGGIGKGLLRPG